MLCCTLYFVSHELILCVEVQTHGLICKVHKAEPQKLESHKPQQCVELYLLSYSVSYIAIWDSVFLFVKCTILLFLSCILNELCAYIQHEVTCHMSDYSRVLFILFNQNFRFYFSSPISVHCNKKACCCYF